MYNDLFEWRAEVYSKKALDLKIDLLLATESISSSILHRALSLGVLRCKIFQSADWASSEQRCQLASTSEGSNAVDPGQLLAARMIFSLRQAEINFFPAYGLHPMNGYQPHAALQAVISAQSVSMDDWPIAS